MTQEPLDPVIDEIRAIRTAISARFGHDPKRLVAYYMDLQKRHKDRLMARPTVPEPDEAAAARARDETELPA